MFLEHRVMQKERRLSSYRCVFDLGTQAGIVVKSLNKIKLLMATTTPYLQCLQKVYKPTAPEGNDNIHEIIYSDSIFYV